MTMHTSEENLSERDYARLCTLVYSEAGIHLGSEKRTMLELRIRRRLKALALGSYRQYCDYVFSREGAKKELVHLIDVVTTNKTDFFREPGHFDFLLQHAIPELQARNEGGRPLLIWSAGCSTGEEPYTLAMLLSDYASAHPLFRFRILASDIATTVLAAAELGVYHEDATVPIPAPLKRRYLMHSRNPHDRRVRVVPELRKVVNFRRLNFMDDDYGITEKVDAVFCRNVIIYFDRQTQERILRKLCQCLVPGGYLFVGHAESLHDMTLPLRPVAPSLYRRNDAGG